MTPQVQNPRGCYRQINAFNEHDILCYGLYRMKNIKVSFDNWIQPLGMLGVAVVHSIEVAINSWNT